MKKAYEILIQGDINQNEIDELILELDNDDLVINKLYTKSQTTQDFVQLVFSDFNVISFTRDLAISGLLTTSLTILKSVINKLKKRNKKIKNVTYEVEIRRGDGKSFSLIFVDNPENFEILIEKADDKINLEFIQDIGDSHMIYISLGLYNSIFISKF